MNLGEVPIEDMPLLKQVCHQS